MHRKKHTGRSTYEETHMKILTRRSEYKEAHHQEKTLTLPPLKDRHSHIESDTKKSRESTNTNLMP